MKTAVVTTCLNEADNVSLWIADIEAQTVLPDEVIVVDAGSTDGTWQILDAWKSDRFIVSAISAPRCSVPQGRNIAIKSSKADIFASTDLGCRIDSQWFREIIEPFHDDPSVDVVAGNFSVDVKTLTTPVAWADYYYYSRFEKTMHKGMAPSGRSNAFRRSVWEKIGGYAEDLRHTAEDSTFAAQVKLGAFKVALAPDALVFWRRHPSWKAFGRESFLYGRGAGEAALPLPWAPRGDWTAIWPAVAAFRAGVQLLGRTAFQSMKMAIADRQLQAATRVHLLTVYKAFHLTRGYAKGYRYGMVHCKECRNRVHPSNLVATLRMRNGVE